LISTLTGSTANDQVGAANFELAVVPLPGGDFVVRCFFWDNGAAVNAGAVTYCDGDTGCNGVVSASNSLVGTKSNDFVGTSAITVLPNGNYVVGSLQWDNGTIVDAGARTWCNGSVGCTGEISAANSLVGTGTNDRIGSFGVQPLADGDYLIASPLWSGGRGAATYCNGSTGCVGEVSAANSLVGSQVGDSVSSGRFVELSNGNYVVHSPAWINSTTTSAGAVTWCSGTSGCAGTVTTANSVVGATASEQLGQINVTPLTNGNYVVPSTRWDTAQPDVGAARLCSGTGGCAGAMTVTNSVVGTQANDVVGNSILALTNGNYVVLATEWNSDTQSDVGAARWCSGTTGCVGAINSSNSLVASFGNSRVGGGGGVALPNGHYVVRSPDWGSGVGAATWCNGTSGCTGTVGAANSLVGSAGGDEISSIDVLVLPSSNYVVISPRWNNGALVDVGAATYCNGATGCVGAVTSSNSLVGSAANDLVGGNVGGSSKVLANGNYIVASPFWRNGATTNAGAVTWCNGNTGCTGPVSAANSAVGNTASQQFSGSVALPDGNYVLFSPNWDSATATDVGAVRWCDGSTGCTGAFTSENSLVGTTANDQVGQVQALPEGDYVVFSQSWDNAGIVNAGAITYGLKNGGTAGPITADNSIRGTVANVGFELTSSFGFDTVNNQLVVGRRSSNLVSLLRFQSALQITGAVSRKMHGVLGPFDIPLPVVGEPGVECRSSGGNHTLVFAFTNSVVSGSASVTSGVGAVAGSPTFSANTMTVNLSGVADVQKITVTLSGVTDSFAQVLPNTPVSMNVLSGDTNGNKSVTATDIGIVKGQSGAPVTAANFRQDLSPNGAISSSDIGLVKSRSGASVP
jgi:hypothetical protein